MTPGERAALLRWFDDQRRELPWRGSRDPYAIWLSEVMLQQTRVATVVPYWLRFLAAFPDVRALAGAPLEQVLSLWSGLGYYSRARALHRAAALVVREHAGELPQSYEGLRALPGVGDYTAGAVASIAFGERVPAVDGNVVRVVARLLALEVDGKAPAGRARVREAVAALVPAERAGDFNQALMELGATLCSPRAPSCGACPVGRACRARAEGRQAELPRPAQRREVSTVALRCFVVHSGARVLLARRPAEGLFGGLWEPPMLEPLLATERPAVTVRRALGRPVRLERAGELVHVLTHRRLEVQVWTGALPPRSALPPCAGYAASRWVERGERSALGLSTLAKKALALGAQGRVG